MNDMPCHHAFATTLLNLHPGLASSWLAAPPGMQSSLCLLTAIMQLTAIIMLAGRKLPRQRPSQQLQPPQRSQQYRHLPQLPHRWQRQQQPQPCLCQLRSLHPPHSMSPSWRSGWLQTQTAALVSRCTSCSPRQVTAASRAAQMLRSLRQHAPPGSMPLSPSGAAGHTQFRSQQRQSPSLLARHSLQLSGLTQAAQVLQQLAGLLDTARCRPWTTMRSS